MEKLTDLYVTILYFIYTFFFHRNFPAWLPLKYWFCELTDNYMCAITGYENIRWIPRWTKSQAIHKSHGKMCRFILVPLSYFHLHLPTPRSKKNTRKKLEASIIQGFKLDTLNFATEVDDDKLSDYECVQNPMKMNNKQTSDRCVEWGSFAKEIHYDEHSNNGKEHDFPVDVERVHNHEDVKQHTMGSAHEITAKSNACFLVWRSQKQECRTGMLTPPGYALHKPFYSFRHRLRFNFLVMPQEIDWEPCLTFIS